MRKALTFTLTALIIAQLAACGGTDTPVDTVETTEAAEATTAAPQYRLPERKDYEGRVFTLLAAGNRSEVYDAEQTGEIVDDAVHARKIAAEDYLGIEINFDEKDSSSKAANQYTSTITSSIMAGETTYDLMTGAMTVIPNLAMDGLFVNLMDMDIDLDNPWWIGDLENTAAINGKLFALTGDLSITLYKNAGVVYFNQKLQDEYKLDDFYSVVRDGKWTLDTMLNASKNITADLNSDGVITRTDDRIAFISHFTPFATIQSAMQVELFMRNGDELVYQGASERLVKLYDKFRTLYDDGTVLVENASSYTEMEIPFKEDRNLFYLGVLNSAAGMRDMESDFGILPSPKYDETQEEYTSPVSMSTVLWAVPVTAADLTLTAEFCEVFAYYGREDIIPAYYEVSLKEKFSRDADTKEMLQIVRDGIRLTPDGYLDRCFNPRPFSILATLLRDNQAPASYIASNEAAWQTQLEAVTQAYAD